MNATHPVFARIYDRRSRALEARGVGEHRRDLLDGLSGEVLELGIGNGLNLGYYPKSVRHVIALEPEPFLLEKAKAAALVAATDVSFIRGVVDAVPLHDESVDAVVCSLVLCSVPSVERALTEVRRVLRAGGQLRFYEHVVAQDGALPLMQRWLNPLWSKLAGGCSLTRDIERDIERAGFEFVSCSRFEFHPTFTGRMTSPHISGNARY